MSRLQGQLNRYTCRACHAEIVTVDTDDGTTPFMIDCVVTRCKGMMESSFYRGVHGTPTYEWRKPTLAEHRKASRATQDHYEQGGLGMWPLPSTSTSAGEPHGT